MRRVGAWLWLVRPLYILTELVVAAGVSVRYSLADNTISDLGAVTCTDLVYAYGDVPVCSPRHDLMNASFVVFGACLVVGAVLLRGCFGTGGRATTATALLVLSGLSSIGTGLAPLDQNADLHYVVALPVFVGQPLALVLLGSLIWARSRVTSAALVAAGVATAAAAVAFAVATDLEHGRGLLERAALWPSFVALAALGVSGLRRPAPVTR